MAGGSLRTPGDPAKARTAAPRQGRKELPVRLDRRTCPAVFEALIMLPTTVIDDEFVSPGTTRKTRSHHKIKSF